MVQMIQNSLMTLRQMKMSVEEGANCANVCFSKNRFSFLVH